MIPTDPPSAFLAQIANPSAATWHAVGGRMFKGEATVETGNRVYHFRDGVFVSRSSGPSRSYEAPTQMIGMRLVGFLANEGGLWSLSTRWRPGSHAVLWRPSAPGEAIDPKSFLLTSQTASFTVEEPEPQPWIAPAAPKRGSQSGVRARRPARPPNIVRPSPPSMTRLHAGPVIPTVIIT